MKSTRVVRLVVVIALLIAAGSLLLWNTMGGGLSRSAVNEERANQERMQQELPRPNESAPKKGAETPR